MSNNRNKELLEKADAAIGTGGRLFGKALSWSLKQGMKGVEKASEWHEEHKQNQQRQAELAAQLRAKREKEKQETENWLKEVELQRDLIRPRVNAEREAKKAEEEKKAQQRAIEHLRKLREHRHQMLEETLADPLNVLEVDLAPYFKGKHHFTANVVLSTLVATKDHVGEWIAVKDKKLVQCLTEDCFHKVGRTVADFNDKEIGVLRLLSLLNTLEVIPDDFYASIELSIVYNNENSFLDADHSKAYDYPKNFITCIECILLYFLKKRTTKPAMAVNRAISTIGQVRHVVNDPELTSIIEKELNNAQGWLKAETIKTT
ncbi:hypothetical protein KFE96_04280 [Kordiimonas sp. SCSIO 12603]|uniref:hypothetical protein n=1 Tax=Kordiimonas sp. SCSIO 12603 TaxID=2829596 RepID=UPI002108439A|nr:hypothetical protein [Kordiimonas sp. SCSIO 12603]UTW59529.1 hypothetical protein KFE96_04280 [Kordiimonas sp. SCSIO 12603]